MLLLGQETAAAVLLLLYAVCWSARWHLLLPLLLLVEGKRIARSIRTHLHSSNNIQGL